MAVRKRNPRVVMREIAAEVKRHATGLGDLLSLPSLVVWRDAPESPLRSYREHGFNRARTRSDVQSWELVENDEKALRRVVRQANYMAERAAELAELARARIDELKRGQGE